jgi:hypothetical protein
MIEILTFTGVAIAIYVASDWILRAIETRRGKALKQRQAIFFLIFLALALISFRIVPILLSG